MPCGTTIWNIPELEDLNCVTIVGVQHNIFRYLRIQNLEDLLSSTFYFSYINIPKHLRKVYNLLLISNLWNSESQFGDQLKGHRNSSKENSGDISEIQNFKANNDYNWFNFTSVYPNSCFCLEKTSLNPNTQIKKVWIMNRFEENNDTWGSERLAYVSLASRKQHCDDTRGEGSPL